MRENGAKGVIPSTKCYLLNNSTENCTMRVQCVSFHSMKKENWGPFVTILKLGPLTTGLFRISIPISQHYLVFCGFCLLIRAATLSPCLSLGSSHSVSPKETLLAKGADPVQASSLQWLTENSFLTKTTDKAQRYDILRLFVLVILFWPTFTVYHSTYLPSIWHTFPEGLEPKERQTSLVNALHIILGFVRDLGSPSPADNSPPQNLTGEFKE